MFTRFAGPTTRVAVEKLRGRHAGRRGRRSGCLFLRVRHLEWWGNACTGGRLPAAGQVSPVPRGWRLSLAAPTHNTPHRFRRCCSCRRSDRPWPRRTAVPTGSLTPRSRPPVSVKSKQHGMAASPAAPTVIRRIELAAQIGSDFSGRPQAAMTELEAIIGNGVAMAEAVPCAIGVVIAAGFSPWRSILAAVNGGNDSDTIAMIAGAIAALRHVRISTPAPPPRWRASNRLDLAVVARKTGGGCGGGGGGGGGPWLVRAIGSSSRPGRSQRCRRGPSRFCPPVQWSSTARICRSAPTR